MIYSARLWPQALCRQYSYQIFNAYRLHVVAYIPNSSRGLYIVYVPGVYEQGMKLGKKDWWPPDFQFFSCTWVSTTLFGSRG